MYGGFDAFAFYSFIALTECRSKGFSSLVMHIPGLRMIKWGSKTRRKKRLCSSRLNSVFGLLGWVGVPSPFIDNESVGRKRTVGDKSSLTGLEVLEEDVHGLGLLTEVLDDNAGAADDLAGVTLAIDLAETGPLAELLGVRDLDQVDVVLSAESLNELDVLLLSAGLDEDGHMGLASIVVEGY
jgi:hypothetical protein